MQSDVGPVALGVLFALTVVTLGAGVRHLLASRMRRHFDARLHHGRRNWQPRVPWRRVLMIAVPAVAVLALAAAVAPALIKGSHSHPPATDPPVRAAVAGASIRRVTLNRAPVIRVTHGSTLTQIGVWSLGDTTLAAARQAFGRPSAERSGPRGCTVIWARIAVTALFSGRCKAPSAIHASTITLRGGWRTWARLRVGDRVSAIRARHPHATAHGKVWWLPTASLAAIVRDGRVAAFQLTFRR